MPGVPFHLPLPLTLFVLAPAVGRLADGQRHREPLLCRSHPLVWGSSIVVVSGGAMGLCMTGSWASSVVCSISSLYPRNRVSFDGNSSHRPAFPLRWPCWKLWPRGGFSVPFLNPFVSYSRDCGSPVSPLASGLRCHLRLLVPRATCWHLCRCPCGVLTHIGRFCASCLPHPSRFPDVACWGLQCVASPFPACLVVTS